MTTTVATDTTSAQTTLNTPIGELKYVNGYPSTRWISNALPKPTCGQCPL